MTKTVSCPGHFRNDLELGIEEIVAYCVLIKYIINITNCLVVLNPSSVCYLQLTVLYKLLYLIFFVVLKTVIPIFEEYPLGHKIFSRSVALKPLDHGVKYLFSIPLVHGIEKSFGSKVDIFEFIISVEPIGVQMWMERYEEFVVLKTALLSCYCTQEQGQEHNTQNPWRFEHHLKYDQYLKVLRRSQINNFNYMEFSQTFESPPIQKISNSAIQFKQLIEALRKKAQVKQETTFQLEAGTSSNKKDQEKPTNSTFLSSEPKTNSQTNNFLSVNQSEQGLKAKPKIGVGDRDKIKKKHFDFDNNPEIQQSTSKEILAHKIQPSFQVQQEQSKDLLESRSRLSPVKNVSTQYQFESSPHINFSCLNSPRNQAKTGQIVKQNLKQKAVINQTFLTQKKIRDIHQDKVLEYYSREERLTQKSDPSKIFSYFTNLCILCDIIIKNPSIKKFKNCIYFGFSIQKEVIYEGFLYFYDSKIYYGEFVNCFKHGLGVELNINDNTKMKGQFCEGRKTGKFYIERSNEKFIGYLENGLYQGEGRLTTPNYVYEGLFDKGEKNGYGQQFYPKTGVRITGIFKNGILSKTKGSRSIPQIRSKSKVSVPKQTEKARLQNIRRSSLQKHNKRMNKLRQRSQRQSEYQINFDTNQEYGQPERLPYNSSKLQMYRQSPWRLPKICQQFEYSFDTDHNIDSIISQHPIFPQTRFQGSRIKRDFSYGGPNERVGTAQFEEPLPTPCLTMFRNRK